jgi:hypothetical protein
MLCLFFVFLMVTEHLLPFFFRRDAAEEGDKRYLSREMLQRSDCDLYKVKSSQAPPHSVA